MVSAIKLWEQFMDIKYKEDLLFKIATLKELKKKNMSPKPIFRVFWKDDLIVGDLIVHKSGEEVDDCDLMIDNEGNVYQSDSDVPPEFNDITNEVTLKLYGITSDTSGNSQG